MGIKLLIQFSIATLTYMLLLAFTVTASTSWTPPPPQHQWNEYGAYFELNELILDLHTSGSMKHPESKIFVNKRIKILTRDGTEYGKVAVTRFSSDIESFQCSVFDSLNNPLPIDTENLRSDYSDNGEIIVPNVTAGASIEIRICFNINYKPESYEYYFRSQSLPVYTGRFVMIYPDEVRYDFKCYGTCDSSMSTITDNRIHKEWICSSLLPVSNLTSTNSDNITPCLAFALRKWYNKDGLTNWKDVADAYRSDYNVTFKKYVPRAIRLLLKTIRSTSPKVSPEEQILQWVREEITWENYDNAYESVREIIKERKASTTGLAKLLCSLYQAAGFKTDIIVSRTISSGGFDQDFITSSSTTVPLVSVTIDNKEKIAYPFTAGGAVGQYPDDFFYQWGVSLQKGIAQPLPAPLDSMQFLTSNYTIDLRNNHLENNATLEFGGYGAYLLRNSLLYQQENFIREVFQAQLTNAGTSNALETFTIRGLADERLPIVVTLRFTNDNVAVFRKNGTQLSIGYLFTPFFEEYDTLRVSPFAIPFSKKLDCTITFALDSNRRYSHTIPSFSVVNPLFTATCRVTATNASITLNLLLQINRCEIPASEMKQIFGDILTLRRLDKATITVLRDGLTSG
ncbi:MAG: hypothetical protein ACM31E_04945 [Fibrobacterota bacterium]|nr:hypothetical protein [Chitinispirillaceae bacterium]